ELGRLAYEDEIVVVGSDDTDQRSGGVIRHELLRIGDVGEPLGSRSLQARLIQRDASRSGYSDSIATFDDHSAAGPVALAHDVDRECFRGTKLLSGELLAFRLIARGCGSAAGVGFFCRH